MYKKIHRKIERERERENLFFVRENHASNGIDSYKFIVRKCE